MNKILAFALASALALLTAITVSAQGPVQITITQVDQSKFPQMVVYISATDGAGHPVRDLSPDAFRIEQNGKPVTLMAATRAGEQGPINTVLVVDHSGSMAYGNKMAGAKQAVGTFINLMRPGDQTALVEFDTEVETLQPLTGDKDALLKAVQKLVPRGNTALFDALAQGGKYFEAASGRKAIIVVTDGMDNASKLNRDAAIRQAEQGGYSIYTVGLGNKGVGTGNQEGIDESVLRDLARASMGTYAYTPDAAQLTDLYQQLSILIQNEYRLTYTSPDPLHDGLRREIVVTAPGAAAGQSAYNPGGLVPEVAPQWESWALFLLAFLLLLGLFFAPTGLRLASERLAPQLSQLQKAPQAPNPPKAPQPTQPAPAPRPTGSRIKLTDTPAGTPSSARPSTTVAPRPSRIKVGKKTLERKPEMPWDKKEAH